MGHDKGHLCLQDCSEHTYIQNNQRLGTNSFTSPVITVTWLSFTSPLNIDSDNDIMWHWIVNRTMGNCHLAPPIFSDLFSGFPVILSDIKLAKDHEYIWQIHPSQRKLHPPYFCFLWECMIKRTVVFWILKPIKIC